MRRYQAQSLGTDRYTLAESPFYQADGEIYSWVDIVEGKLFIRRNGETSSISFGEMIGAAIPLGDGAYMVAGQKAIYKAYADGKKEVCASLENIYDANHRSNDAKLDPRGRLVFGSVSLEGAPNGSLYSYDGEHIRVLEKETKLANGMAWSRDEKTFFFSDSQAHGVFCYDYDIESGDISGRRTLCEITDGVPDGLTIDADDNIWLAVWGGSRIEHRDGRSGELLGVIDVPARQASSCYFCGADRLFITSAREGLDGPDDGGLFICEL